uniref:Uncharacterized protein n=1 Tax=Salix viminalis TaxID=40686 RepID=A0A6N2LCH6_SALVM
MKLNEGTGGDRIFSGLSSTCYFSLLQALDF